MKLIILKDRKGMREEMKFVEFMDVISNDQFICKD